MVDEKRWLKNASLDQRRASQDAGQMNRTDQRPGSNSLIRELQLLIYKCGDYWPKEPHTKQRRKRKTGTKGDKQLAILGATLHKEDIEKEWIENLARMRLFSDHKPKTRWPSLDNKKERSVF